MANCLGLLPSCVTMCACKHDSVYSVRLQEKGFDQIAALKATQEQMAFNCKESRPVGQLRLSYPC
jgi:hypothetical protein